MAKPGWSIDGPWKVLTTTPSAPTAAPPVVFFMAGVTILADPHLTCKQEQAGI